MLEIIIRAACFIGIIALGYTLKKINFLKQEDFTVLSKIVIRITLTATIVVSFNGKVLDLSMLLMAAFGLGFGVLMMVLSAILARKKGRKEQAFAMVNSAGCNIGNFALPFAQSFLGPISVIAVSLFDAGNGLICLGGSHSFASAWQDETKKFSVGPLLKALVKSVPLMTYICMTILCLIHVQLPGPIISYATIIANANAFLAMFMIGVGFRLSGEKSQLKDILRILGTRYVVGITLALVSWFFLPVPAEWKQALVILFLAPVPSAAPGYTAEMKGNYGLASAINSFSILISICLITLSLVLMLG